jgi:hypothetical protein
MEYDHPSFEGFDDATVSNLDALVHHARQAPQRDAESVQLLIKSVVGIHRMLPQPIRSIISLHECNVGDRHMRVKPEQLARLWEAITVELRAGLVRVIESRADLLADEQGLAGRGTTQGEKILATFGLQVGDGESRTAETRRWSGFEGGGRKSVGGGVREPHAGEREKNRALTP